MAHLSFIVDLPIKDCDFPWLYQFTSGSLHENTTRGIKTLHKSRNDNRKCSFLKCKSSTRIYVTLGEVASGEVAKQVNADWFCFCGCPHKKQHNVQKSEGFQKISEQQRCNDLYVYGFVIYVKSW